MKNKPRLEQQEWLPLKELIEEELTDPDTESLIDSMSRTEIISMLESFALNKYEFKTNKQGKSLFRRWLTVTRFSPMDND